MWWILIGIGIFIGLFFAFVRWTIVEEGTAKIIMRWGGMVKVFLQWEGYRLDENGNIVSTGQKNPWYGGLRVWIGLPIDKVYKYKLRWHSVEEVEGKRIPKFHEEIKDYVMVRPDRYWLKMPRVETKDGHFPDIEWLIGMRVINPVKTIFKSPHNWVENALSQLQPTLRAFVRTKSLVELMELSREQIWQEIFTSEEGKRVIEGVLKEEWGIQIDLKEIAIFDVSPPPGYQEALAAKSRMEMEAAGRAAETVGTVIQMIAQARGRTPEEIKSEIDTDPELKKQFLELARDLIVRKMGIEGQSYVDIRVIGAEGLERMILNALAAWRRMPGRERSNKKKKKERDWITKEEVEEEKKKYMSGEWP